MTIKNKARILFFILSSITLAGISVWISLSIKASYFPNTYEGNWGLKYSGSIVALFAIHWFVALYVFLWTAEQRRLKLLGIIGVIFLALIAIFFISTQFERDYRRVFYIGGQTYAVPWRYDPGGVQAEEARSGQEFFRISVSYPDFAPYYIADSHRMDLDTMMLFISAKGNSSINDFGPNRIDLRTVCSEIPCDLPDLSGTNPRYRHLYFTDGDLHYTIAISIGSDMFKDRAEVERFMGEVKALLDSFKVAP